MVIRMALLIAALMLFSESVLAKTLYVDAQNGDDSITYDQNSANEPWRTIGRAAWGSTDRSQPNTAQAARAGDIVSIAAGIYWETGARDGRRFTVSLNPANNGTAGNPIVFRGEGLVYVRMQAGYRGGMIGCEGRNYIVWDNLQIDDFYGGSTSDTGPVVFTADAAHCQIINSDIKGHPGSYYHGYPTFGGNYRGISLEPANHIVIAHNRIHNFRGGQNEAGIMSYDSDDNVIENNELFNNGTAIFIKGVHAGRTQARNIIRYNIVRNNSLAGIRVLSAQDTHVYQNLLINNDDTALWAGFYDSTRSRFVNNTVYNNPKGLVTQGETLIDVVFHGNIVAGNIDAIQNWIASNPSTQDVHYDRNVYFSNRLHANFGGGRFSFSAWQDTWRQDLNGQVSDPQFVDPSIGDFRLRSGSPSLTASVDVLDLTRDGNTTDIIPAGAYLTGNEIIGPISGFSLEAAPRPPTNIGIE